MFSGGVILVQYLRFTSPRSANNRYEWRQGSSHFRFCPETQNMLQQPKHANAGLGFPKPNKWGLRRNSKDRPMVPKVRVTIAQ